MVLENVKNILSNLFSYFNIEGTTVSVRSYFLRETPGAQIDLLMIPPEGSSVDPEPLPSFSNIEKDSSFEKESLSSVKENSNAPEGCGESGGESARGGNTAALKEVDNALPKASLCADTLSQDLSLETGLDSYKKSCVEEVASEESALCRKESNTDANAKEETCLLHRLFPSAASTANSSAPRSVQIRGKVTFNPPLFSEHDFNLRIIKEKVCLEFIQIDAEKIHGYVRVLNRTYVKDVTVCYTENDWKAVSSRKATWMETVSDGTMDRFAFTIPGRKSVGNLSFSVTFNGIADNNKRQSYTVVYDAI